jgi:hypothetical protein
MRFKASFSETLARGGRSTLSSLISFARFIKPPPAFSYIRGICQRSRLTPGISGELLTQLSMKATLGGESAACRC